MKKFLITIIIILIAIILIINVKIFMDRKLIADKEKKQDKEIILTGETMSSIDEVYKEITDLNYQNSSKTFDLSIINEFDLKVKKDNTFDNIKYYQNGLDSIIEVIIEKQGCRVTFNYDTGEFLSYSANGHKKYRKTNKKEDEIRKIAIEIYDQMSIKEEGYEIIELQQFDDEIWRATFAKKYGDLINNGETIKLSFSPESKEILTLHKSNIKFANNSIEITEDEAEKFANIVNFNNVDMKCNIEIVRPNYFYKENNPMYKRINIYRKAYVFTLEDDSKTKIYVDCTTGEIIGGDKNL